MAKKHTHQWMLGNEFRKVPEDELRDKRITLRVTEAQRDYYNACSKAMGITTADMFLGAVDEMLDNQPDD